MAVQSQDSKGLAESASDMSAPIKVEIREKEASKLEKLKEMLTPSKPEWKTVSSGVRG